MFLNSANIYYSESKTINYGWQGNFKGQLLIYNGSSIVKSIQLDNSKYVYDYYNEDNYSNSFSTSILCGVGEYTLKIINSNGTIVVQSSVTIKKALTHVESYYYEVFKNYKDLVNIYLEEKNTKKPIGGTVTVKINGKSYNVTVKESIGELTFTSPSKLKKYQCTINYSGDSNHEASSNTFTFNVVKYDSDVLVSDLSKVKPGAKIKITAKVYYKYGTKKVSSGIVKFIINGKTYKAKIKNGVTKVTIKAPTKSKTYTCKATYSGNKNIKNTYTIFKLGVKKKITLFTVTVPVKLDKYSSKKWANMLLEQLNMLNIILMEDIMV